MAWEAFTATQYPLAQGAVLDAAYLNKLSNNVVASGANSVRFPWDIVYYGGDPDDVTPMKRLSLVGGVKGSIVQVRDANTLQWSDNVSRDYRGFLDEPGIVASQNNSVLISQLAGLDYLQAFSQGVDYWSILSLPSSISSGGIWPDATFGDRGTYGGKRISNEFGHFDEIMSDGSGFIRIGFDSSQSRPFFVINNDLDTYARVAVVKIGYHTKVELMDVRTGHWLADTREDLLPDEIILDSNGDLEHTYTRAEASATSFGPDFTYNVTANVDDEYDMNKILYGIFVLNPNLTAPTIPSSPFDVTHANGVFWRIHNYDSNIVTGFEINYRVPWISGEAQSSWQSVIVQKSAAVELNDGRFTTTFPTFIVHYNLSRSWPIGTISELRIRSLNSAGSGELYRSPWSSSSWRSH